MASSVHIHAAKGRKIGVEETLLDCSQTDSLAIWIMVDVTGYIQRNHTSGIGWRSHANGCHGDQ